jgi:hypothetical protein
MPGKLLALIWLVVVSIVFFKCMISFLEILRSFVSRWESKSRLDELVA